MKIFFVVLMTFCISGEALSSYQSTNLFYTVSWGNISLAKSQLDYKFSSDNVQITAQVKSRGLVFLFTGFESVAEAKLVKKSVGWTPRSLFMKRDSGRKNIESSVIWNNDGSVLSETRVPELDLTEVFPLENWMRAKVLDPYSAILRLIDQVDATGKCESKFEIYDGRRRSRLYFETFGKAKLEQDRPYGFFGNTIICRVRFDPIGGHRIEQKWRSETDDADRFKLFLGRPYHGQLLPVRIEVKSWLGKIVGRLDTRRIQFGDRLIKSKAVSK